jgi:hypothetical protein
VVRQELRESLVHQELQEPLVHQELRVYLDHQGQLFRTDGIGEHH